MVVGASVEDVVVELAAMRTVVDVVDVEDDEVDVGLTEVVVDDTNGTVAAVGKVVVD